MGIALLDYIRCSPHCDWYQCSIISFKLNCRHPSCRKPKPEIIMQVPQLCNAPKEAVKLAVEKQSPPVKHGVCVSPFTFSHWVQSADIGSFIPPVPLKNHARHG